MPVQGRGSLLGSGMRSWMPSELSLAASDRSPYLPDDAGGLSGQEDALALGSRCRSAGWSVRAAVSTLYGAYTAAYDNPRAHPLL